MTTRRDFLHLALTAPLLPASLRMGSPRSTEVPSTKTSVESLYAALCDERFAASVAFAEEMARHGTPVTRFRGETL